MGCLILPLTSDPRSKAITARHLLSHSSGLQDWRSPQHDQFDFAFTPGSRFSWSGEGYFYLQRVVEKITRTPFARYTRETVLERIGMTRSSYAWRPDPANAAGHDYRGGLRSQFNASIGAKLLEIAAAWKKPVEDWFYGDMQRATQILKQPALPDFIQPNAASSLRTTVNDYAKFLEYGFEGSRVTAPQRRLRKPGLRWRKAAQWS